MGHRLLSKSLHQRDWSQTTSPTAPLSRPLGSDQARRERSSIDCVHEQVTKVAHLIGF